MLKIWSGPEMEGVSLGERTLFICSTEKIDYSAVKNFVLESDISKVYLGAGRENFLGFTDDNLVKEFRQDCIAKNASITIETTPENVPNILAYLPFCEVIIVIRDPIISVDFNVKLKLDDYKTARIFDNSKYYDTDLSDVSDQRYSCDTILYEED